MSIHFISGKPGGGKTFYSVKLIFEELRYGSRHIVTNVALNVGQLNAYYQEHFADDSGWKKYAFPWWLPFKLSALLFWYLPEVIALKVFPIAPEQADNLLRKPRQDDICQRIHLITDEEMAVFFTKRPGSTIEHINKDEWRAGKRPDYSIVKDCGVLFVLDEIHIPFNSRAWAETGAEVLYYLSQHRKLGDDVLAITQAVANVDKQFRSVAQDFTYIRNLAKETFGHFRLPSRFIRKTYSQPPSGDRSEPMEMGSFTLDVQGLAKCYDTAKGIGIHGRAGADTKARKKGIHWLWFAIGLPVVAYAILHFIPYLTVHLFGRGFGKQQAAQKEKMKAVSPAPVAPSAPARILAASSTNFFVTSEVSTNAVLVQRLTCRGYIIQGDNITVFLSDGSSYDSRSGEVTLVTHRKAQVNGVVYDFKPADPVPYLPTAMPPAPPSPGPVETSSDPGPQIQVIYFGHHEPRAVSQTSGFQRIQQNGGGSLPPPAY